MATHDYIVDNAVGATVRADINSALAAIASTNSSATEPATMYAYQLWFDTSVGYMKQRNSTNTAWEGVSVAPATAAAHAVPIGQLAASSGSSLVGFRQSGTGAVARTLQDKGRDVVSVEDFGAVGDGVTDNAVAFQAAADTGLSIYVPQGTYYISAPVRLKTTSQKIRGDGDLSVLLTTSDIETFYTNTDVWGVVLSDLSFKNTVSEAAFGMTAFHVHFGVAASGCTVTRCSFNTALTGNVVRTTHNGGVWFGGANLNNILDCTFGMAHILMESTDSTIRGGYIYSFAHQYAIQITSAGEVVVDAVRGILGGPDKGCIWITQGYMNKIVNCYFGGSSTTMNIGKGILADQQQMLQVIGNTFHEVDGVGVHLTNPTGCIVNGNTFWAGTPKQNDPTLLIPGAQDILIEGILYGASRVIVTNNVFNRFNGPIEDGMPGIGKSYAVEFGTAVAAADNIVTGNAVYGVRYFSPAFNDPHINDKVHSNAGTATFRTYTPVLTNVTIGNGTVTGEFTEVNNELTLRVSLIVGSTTVFTAERIEFSLPKDAAQFALGAADMYDASAVAVYSSIAKVAGVAGGNLFINSVSGGGTAWNNALPVAPAVGDTYSAQITYRTAA